MADRDEAADGTFGGSRPVWLGRLDKVRNVVRQEMIARQLDRHLRTPRYGTVSHCAPARPGACPR